jgi:hypothetical protein
LILACACAGPIVLKTGVACVVIGYAMGLFMKWKFNA